LHSYGFTNGINTALWSYYYGQWGLMAICGVHYLIERAKQQALSGAPRSDVPRATPHSTEGRTV
jgi:hypothetical protein